MYLFFHNTENNRRQHSPPTTLSLSVPEDINTDQEDQWEFYSQIRRNPEKFLSQNGAKETTIDKLEV